MKWVYWVTCIIFNWYTPCYSSSTSGMPPGRLLKSCFFSTGMETLLDRLPSGWKKLVSSRTKINRYVIVLRIDIYRVTGFVPVLSKLRNFYHLFYVCIHRVHSQCVHLLDNHCVSWETWFFFSSRPRACMGYLGYSEAGDEHPHLELRGLRYHAVVRLSAYFTIWK